MKVKDIMTRDAKACTPTATLAEAAGSMWESDCGVLPVVAEDGKVIGLITDRDICMAGALNNRNLSDIAVDEVITGNVFSTSGEDDIRKALETMHDHRIRRLAVVDADGALEGMLSLNDIVLVANEVKGNRIPAVSFGDVVNAFKAICAHPAGGEKSQTVAAGT